MELKVWVEGVQRIVCGVTERTTCQVRLLLLLCLLLLKLRLLPWKGRVTLEQLRTHFRPLACFLLPHMAGTELSAREGDEH